MGLIDRIAMLVRANLNDLIDRAEDPEKVIKQLLIDMRQQLTQAKSESVGTVAAEKRVYAQYQETEKKAQEWKRKAQLALDTGDEALAREALKRRVTHGKAAEALHEQWQLQRSQVQALKTGLMQLENKINETEARSQLLIARHRGAKAREQIQKTMAKLDSHQHSSHFARLERRVEEQSARAAAYAELNNTSLNDRFADLEHDAEVERQLQEMKNRKRQAALDGEVEAEFRQLKASRNRRDSSTS